MTSVFFPKMSVKVNEARQTWIISDADAVLNCNSAGPYLCRSLLIKTFEYTFCMLAAVKKEEKTVVSQCVDKESISVLVTLITSTKSFPEKNWCHLRFLRKTSCYFSEYFQLKVAPRRHFL